VKISQKVLGGYFLTPIVDPPLSWEWRNQRYFLRQT